MRQVKYIVLHCTATPVTTNIASIQNYWKTNLGWKNPGYHYLIERNGNVVQLQKEDKIANGVKGFNESSIHISYIGGVDKNNKPLDNRTRAQEDAMFSKIVELTEKYPTAIIKGHRDFPFVKKACPSFDAKTWLQNYTPDLKIAA